MREQGNIIDIHPETPVAILRTNFSKEELSRSFDADLVCALVGMSSTFVRKALGHSEKKIALSEVLLLLNQDAFSETFIPRSRIPDYLLSQKAEVIEELTINDAAHKFFEGNAKELIQKIPSDSVRCVVTSTPYWAMRLYDTHCNVQWADGEICAFGHEQTPEGFIRHTVELLFLLKRVMREDGSIWWNLMDSFNTRTQIRKSAVETLKAMKGEDSRGWKDHACRRYSAGHAYLKDGEVSMIPSRIAERASRIGYWVKSQITWKKLGSMPETVATRVTREAEYILHFSLQRSPYFDKQIFRYLSQQLGGRNTDYESEKITDVWCLATAAGIDGHGAQFPLSLPGRCIALSTQEEDLVLDPFVGSGTTSIAAKMLNRRSIGIDIDKKYLETAQRRLNNASLKFSDSRLSLFQQYLEEVPQIAQNQLQADVARIPVSR